MQLGISHGKYSEKDRQAAEVQRMPPDGDGGHAGTADEADDKVFSPSPFEHTSPPVLKR